MKINIDPWQEEILKQKGDLLLCTGRRTGKTYIMSRKAIEHMVKYKKQIIVVSLTEDQAMLIIAYALEYAREFCPKLLGKGKYKPTLRNLTIMVGKTPIRMISRPVGNTGDATRGFTGGVLIVDEAARMPKMFWIAAKPVLLTQAGEIWMCSTPFGKRGYFWERFDEAYNKKDPDSRFKVFYQNTEDVMEKREISDSWTLAQREGALRILKEDKKEMSTLEYGQEYKGLFLEDLNQFFPDEWIEQTCTIKKEETAIKKSNENYLGVDIARLGGDEIAFEGLDKINKEKMLQNLHEVYKEKLTTFTEDRIYQLNEIYDFTKIYIDAGAGSLGVGVFDQLLRDDRTKRKVEAINNRKLILDREEKGKQKLMKEDLYNNLLNLGWRKHIKLFNDDKIRLSLKSVQYEIISTQTGKPQVRIFGKYTHIAEALIRAAWCSKEKFNKIWIRYKQYE